MTIYLDYFCAYEYEYANWNLPRKSTNFFQKNANLDNFFKKCKF